MTPTIILMTSLAFGAPVATRAALVQQAASNRLAVLLKEWEKVEGEVIDIHKVVRRTKFDPTFQETTISQIEVTGKKPDLLRFEVKDAKGHTDGMLICVEDRVRWFNFKTRTESTYDLPYSYPSKVAKSDLVGIMIASWECHISLIQLYCRWICMGIEARRLTDRYDLKIAKQDENYVYLTAKPKLSKTTNWPLDPILSDVMIALTKTTFQPRTIVLSEPNGTKTTWEFLEIKTNLIPPVSKEKIQANLPEGFKRLESPKREFGQIP